MGLQKWVLKNGPGSPGKTAKFYLNYYKRLKTANPSANWEDLFYTMYADRLNTNNIVDPSNKRASILMKEDPEMVIGYSESDFRLFVFMMLFLETEQFRKGISMGQEGKALTLEVIHETVASVVPTMIKLNNAAYVGKVDNFISHFS